jgi:hypothetical protein
MTPRRRYQQAAWTRRAILSGRCVRCGRKKTAVTRPRDLWDVGVQVNL